ncbi:MAG TPA: hypothetical protein VKV25_08010 [Acidimicrobiales bacterium]|nr:hypothetical protein [Acidimicrobiales bacterium]
MPKDRDQLTPDEPEDAERLATSRRQGTGATGEDVLPGERSAPGASATSADPRAVDEVDESERGKYE